MMPSPRRRFRLGSTMTNRTLSGDSSPRKISGRRWKSVSPSSPPTANATITVNDDGSMLGGHSASRKSVHYYLNLDPIRNRKDVLGGPEMYNVARRAFTAGLPGNKTEKILDVKLVVSGIVARLCSLSVSTNGHFFYYLSKFMPAVSLQSVKIPAIHPRSELLTAPRHWQPRQLRKQRLQPAPARSCA